MCKKLSMEETKYLGKNNNTVSSSRILSCKNCKGIIIGKDGKERERKIRDPLPVDITSNKKSTSKRSKKNNEIQYTVDRDVNGYRNILYVFLDELHGRKKLEVFKRGIPLSTEDGGSSPWKPELTFNVSLIYKILL